MLTLTTARLLRLLCVAAILLIIVKGQAWQASVGGLPLDFMIILLGMMIVRLSLRIRDLK